MWRRALLGIALRGPGKGLFLASAAGWVALTWLVTDNQLTHSAVTSGHVALHPPRDFTAMWLAMILAMAPPLLLREIGHLWRTSLRRLRHLTIASFACGYVGVWLFVGVALATLAAWMTVNPGRIAGVFALVLLWHCSPVRQRCLNACHRVPPLRVFGMAALWDSWRYGISAGCYCAATCSLLMLLVLLVKDYHLAVVALACLATRVERHVPARRPGWRLPLLLARSPEWPDIARATS